MYEIVKKEQLAANIYQMDVKAPMVTHSCLPGQFVIAIAEEDGEDFLFYLK